eukprot:TRINITY_DN34626_c0_g2_i1.p1 TRINITY_DN34626_c0_g2~~TRINITY_DN34626_c0_g2_i1.p1  ORF type:complete len:299 (-),score=47.85 TRINITY_DN34626_c0_g2_i1:184-1080(-)
MSSQQQLCERCGKGHFTSECRWMTGACFKCGNIGACFKCGNMGHKAADCSFSKGSQSSYSQAPSTAVVPPLQSSRLVAPQSRPQRPYQAQPRSQFRASAPLQQFRPPLPPQQQHYRQIAPSQRGLSRPRGRMQRQQQRSRQSGQVYAMDRQYAEASAEVVEGMIYVSNVEAKVLFDPGSSHSYIFPMFASRLGGEMVESLHVVVLVSTPVGKHIRCEEYFPQHRIKISDFAILASLIILPMTDFDVILGMDWLSSYHVVMDCFNKTIQLKVEENFVEFVGEKKKMITRRISALKADVC